MKLRFAIICMLAMQFAGCATPEEKFANFIKNGQHEIELGHLDKAKIEFKNALQIKNKNSEALWGLVTVYEQERNLDKVYELCLTIVQQDPHFLKARLKLASFYLAMDKQEALDEMLAALERQAPQNADVLAFKAAVALKAKQTQQAIDYAKQALAVDRRQSDAVMVLASAHAAQGQVPQALRDLDTGISDYPNAASLYFAKVALLKQSSAWSEVEKVLLELIKRFPQQSEYQHVLAQFYQDRQLPQKAEEVFNQMIQRNPGDTRAILALVSLHNQHKGTQAARTTLATFIRRDPDNIELQFAGAQFAQRTGHADEALQWFEGIATTAKKKEDQLKARSMLAAHYYHNGNIQLAEQQVDQILVEDSRNVNALLIKAKLQIHHKRYDDAISHLRILLDGAPKSVPFMLELAHAYDLYGATALAEQYYVQAIKVSQNAVQAGLAYSDFLIRKQRLDKAESVLETVIQQHATHPEANSLLAQLKISKKDWSAAKLLADRLKQQSDSKLVGHQIAAKVFLEQKMYARAVVELEQASRMKPQNFQLIADIVASQVAAGQSHQAITFLKSKINNKQHVFNARVLLAELYSKYDPGLAMQVYQVLADDFPERKEGPLGMYQMLLKKGQQLQAIRMIEQASQKAPQLVELQLLRADLYHQDGKVEEAIAIYEALVKNNPGNVLMRNNLVGLLIESRQDQPSLQRAYQLAVALSMSNVPNVRDTYGWAAYKAGRYQESIKALTFVVEKAPEVGLFQYHLGKAYLANQDKQNAQQALQAAVKHYDNTQGYDLEEVKQLLAEAD